MLKTMESGLTWGYPIDKKSKIKCEGYNGCYTIIDAATVIDSVFLLLEHDYWGDETPCLVVELPTKCLRWYVIEKNDGSQIKRLFIRSDEIIEETYDGISDALCNYYLDLEPEEIEYWTDEEINNMEVI